MHERDLEPGLCDRAVDCGVEVHSGRCECVHVDRGGGRPMGQTRSATPDDLDPHRPSEMAIYRSEERPEIVGEEGAAGSVGGHCDSNLANSPRNDSRSMFMRNPHFAASGKSRVSLRAAVPWEKARSVRIR